MWPGGLRSYLPKVTGVSVILIILSTLAIAASYIKRKIMTHLQLLPYIQYKE